MNRTTLRVLPMACLALAAAVAGCGGGSKGTSTSNAGASGAQPPNGAKGELTGTVSNVSGTKVTVNGKTVNAWPGAVQGMQPGDQVVIDYQGDQAKFVQDKARDQRASGSSGGTSAISDSSSCQDWQSASNAVRLAYLDQFASAHGVPTSAEPGIGGIITGKCADGSTDQVGTLAQQAVSGH